MDAQTPSDMRRWQVGRDMHLWQEKMDNASAAIERLKQDLQLAEYARERDGRRWKWRAVALLLFGLLGGLGLGKLVGLWMP